MFTLIHSLTILIDALFIQFLGTGDPLTARHHRLAQTPAGATALPRDKPIAAHTCSHVCTCARRERPLDHTHACAYMRPAGTLGTHPAVHAGKGVQAYWSLAGGDRMARVTAEPYSPFPPNLCSQPLLPPRTPAPSRPLLTLLSAHLSSQGLIIASMKQEPHQSSHSKKNLGYISHE